MTSAIGRAVTQSVIQRMSGPTGVNSNLAALTQENPAQTALAGLQVVTENAAPDLLERTAGVQYPTANVCCAKIKNSLKEKFRTFSGSAQMVVEIRHSQDRVDGLQDALELYVDSTTQVLSASRGDWSGGMFYSGGYEVSFGPLKKGGKNFIQTAVITFEIGISRS